MLQHPRADLNQAEARRLPRTPSMTARMSAGKCYRDRALATFQLQQGWSVPPVQRDRPKWWKRSPSPAPAREVGTDEQLVPCRTCSRRRSATDAGPDSASDRRQAARAVNKPEDVSFPDISWRPLALCSAHRRRRDGSPSPSVKKGPWEVKRCDPRRSRPAGNGDGSGASTG
jgi:hypothetical protein